MKFKYSNKCGSTFYSFSTWMESLVGAPSKKQLQYLKRTVGVAETLSTIN